MTICGVPTGQAYFFNKHFVKHKMHITRKKLQSLDNKNLSLHLLCCSSYSKLKSVLQFPAGPSVRLYTGKHYSQLPCLKFSIKKLQREASINWLKARQVAG